MKIAAIGECLIELTGCPADLVSMNYAGDTYNTSFYLAQLNSHWHIAYVTALGIDPYSQDMVKTWQRQGIHTDQCVYFNDKIPGLYLVNTDENGERTFFYYRQQSAASQLFNHPNIEPLLEALLSYDCLYLSGISFAILTPLQRLRLFDFVKQAKQSGVGIVYDNNYRPNLWGDRQEAQQLAEQLCPLTDCFFVTQADESLLFGDVDAKATCQRYQAWSPKVLVVKDGANPCLVSDQGHITCRYPAAIDRVVDTTGAGDAFNAGFLTAYWQGNSIDDALKQGHHLAGEVIQYRGAILPASQFENMAALADG